MRLSTLPTLVVSSALLLLFLGFLIPSSQADFVDVAETAGISAIIYAGSQEKNHLVESLGSGAAFIDYDNDDDLDIYLVNGWQLRDRSPSIRGSNVLYRNRGDGTFEDVTQQAGVGDQQWGVSVCVADYDGDGWLDMYITNFGPNILYRNNGDGTFADVTEHAGVGDDRWAGCAAFLDADGDRDLDLYVANYVAATLEEVLFAERELNWQGVEMVMVGPRGMEGAEDIFYLNNGDGTFTDATEESGLLDVSAGYGLGVCATDYDLDGDLDIYVANDAQPNYLYQNNGDGTFMDVGFYAGVGLMEAGIVQASMGVDFADFDNDGDLDGWVTNYTGEYCTLYQNIGDGLFEDVTALVGLWQPTYLPMGWGTNFFDYDHDTDLDLFIANGHIYPQVDQHPAYGQTYAQPNQMFQNDEGHFLEITPVAGSGFQIVESSRAAAFGDYDNDGDLDILVTNIDAPPTLLQNQGAPQKSWLMVQLTGSETNRFAIGALVRLKMGDEVQMREVRSGNSFASQNDLRVHFGCGEHDTVDWVEVRWPSGQRTVRENVATRQVLKIVEPTKSEGHNHEE